MLSLSHTRAIFLIAAILTSGAFAEGFDAGPSGFPPSFAKFSNKGPTSKNFKTEGVFRQGWKGLGSTYEFEKRFRNYGGWGPHGASGGSDRKTTIKGPGNFYFPQGNPFAPFPRPAAANFGGSPQIPSYAPPNGQGQLTPKQIRKATEDLQRKLRALQRKLQEMDKNLR